MVNSFNGDDKVLEYLSVFIGIMLEEERAIIDHNTCYPWSMN